MEDGLPELPSTISDATKEGVEHAMEIRKNKRPASIDAFLSHFADAPITKLSEVKVETHQNQNLLQSTIVEDLLQPTAEEIDDDTVFATVVSMPDSKKNYPSKVDSGTDNSIIDDCKFVNLGLSVLWTSHNMGAKRPEDLGTFVNKLDVSTTIEVSEWNLKGALVPTIGQFDELRNNCNWEWTEQKGVGGYKITGRNGNSIFIPFSGDNKDNPFRIFGRLFTRESLYNDSPAGQYYLYFSHGDYKLVKYACDYICPIRLIKQK